MEKKCCTIEVEELEEGFRIEIKGEGLKEKCRGGLAGCCSEEGVRSWFRSICSTGSGGSGKASCC